MSGVGAPTSRGRRAPRPMPPPPVPPPGMGARRAFAPPVPRKDHTALIVTLVLATVLLLFCVVGSGIGGLFYVAYKGMQNDAIKNVDGYLGDLRGGNFSAAYARLCPEATSRRSVAEFARSEQAKGEVIRYTVDRSVKADQDGDWVITATVVRAELPARAEYFPIKFDDANKPQVCPSS